MKAGIAVITTGCKKSKMNHSTTSTHKTLDLKASNFRTTIDGKHIDLYLLHNNNGMEVAITNYGGRIVGMTAPDAKGNWEDVVLGFDSIKGYLNAREVYFGALVGRYANRIARGKFSLDGKQYQLATNNGLNHLHGGAGGFPNVVWDAHKLDDQHLILHYISDDTEEGYPGRLNVKVLYTLEPDNTLSINYTATTNKETIINLTNHAFFNLHGTGESRIVDHKMMINADKYTPIDSTMIPTGEIASVEGTPFDFTEPVTIGRHIHDTNKQLRFGHGYDHNFVLNKHDSSALTLAAQAWEPASGRVLEVYTTQPGLQFYSGNFLNGRDVGKHDRPYRHRAAFCLETQHFPDSPNNPNFPTTVLKPGEIFKSITEYHCTVKALAENR